MKSIRNTIWAKLLAAILFLLCVAMSLACFAGVSLFREYGMYGQSEQTVRKNLEQAALTKYSVTAMFDYLLDKDVPLSEQFRYAIYQGTVDPKNMKDAKKLAGNTAEFPASAAVHTFRVGPDPGFQLAGSIFDEAYIYGQFEPSETLDFEGFARINGMDGLYVRDYNSEQLYRIDDACWHTDTQDNNWNTLFVTDSRGATLAIPRSGIHFLNSTSAAASDKADSPAEADSSAETGTSAGSEADNNSVSDAETNPDYDNDSAVVTEDDSRIIISSEKVKTFSIEDWTFSLAGDTEGASTYTVLSYADRNREAADAASEQNTGTTDPAAVPNSDTAEAAAERGMETAAYSADFFEQADRFVGLGFRLRYVALAMIPVSLFLGLLCFLFLLWAAGHREQDGDQIVLRGLDRMPMDLFALLAIILSGTAIAAASNISYAGLRIFLPVMCLAVLGSAFLLLLFCMSAAVNLKAGTLWKRMLAGRLLGWLNRKRTDLRKHTAGIAMNTRIWILFILFIFLELAGIVLLIYDSSPLFLAAWLFEKVLFLLLLAKLLREFGILKQTAEDIAAGNMEAKADTKNMFLDFEQHGNALNRIGSGLSEAVEERIRSERMKTELITNVSHDIKTPLTSIISYTDLLARLDLDDPQAKEYIEVLSRQSDRLKKLIEDLIEASKASSGTLKMEMEDVDADMVLVQAIGEFDEKLRASNIDYRIQRKSGHPLVRADSRYLWRIFDNLLSNICKYAQPGTRAYIDMDETDRQVVITFRNVSEAPLHISGEELKARFVQGDSSRAAEGSGLGLSIADSLAGLMGGELDLTVDGDLFKVELKLQKAAALSEEALS